MYCRMSMNVCETIIFVVTKFFLEFERTNATNKMQFRRFLNNNKNA